MHADCDLSKQSMTVQARKMEALGMLASGIAHEINTPLQYVMDNIRFVQDSLLDYEQIFGRYESLLRQITSGTPYTDEIDQIRECEATCDLAYLRSEVPEAINHAHGGLEQITKIVASIKTFAHPGVEVKEPTDLNAVIETTITISRNRWKYVASLTTDFQPDLPHIPCIGGEIGQVVLNLVVNAAQAIEAKAPQELGQIGITTRLADGFAEITVEDSGCGIKDDDRRRIFEPFFTTKTIGHGTGQGLALCHDIIVNRHGGKILVETQVGCGTKFCIHLPLQASDGGQEVA